MRPFVYIRMSWSISIGAFEELNQQEYHGKRVEVIIRDFVSVNELKKCLTIYVYEDSGMRENDIFAVRNRLRFIFDNKRYIENVKRSDKNWLEIPIEEAVEGICAFFDGKELE